MCRIRIRSSGVIADLGIFQDFVPKVPAQLKRGAEVDFPAGEQLGQLPFHSGHCQHPDVATGHEFDEDIDIAVRAEIISQYRTEQGKALDLVPNAEFFDIDLRNI
jgi:hypothetical protein